VNLDRVGSSWVERRLAARTKLALRGTTSRALPPHVRAAVLEALDEHDAMPPSHGLTSLREAIGALHGRDPESEVLVTAGAQHALSVAFRALLADGDEVVVPSPTYSFGGAIRRAGGVPVYVTSRLEDGWRIDVDAVAAACTAATQVLVLCNPGNPTGVVHASTTVEALVGLCRDRGITLLTDEAYERYVYDGSLASAAALDEGVVLVRSVGKSYALPGWRLGYVVAPSRVVDACRTVVEWDCLRLPHVAQRAGAAAITGPGDWLADVADEYRRCRDAAFAAAEQAGIACALPAAGPFLFLDVRGVDGAWESLHEAGIPVVPGAFFEAPGFVRLAFGADEQTLAELATRLRAWAGASSQ
jgi:aspartate/methionine/tyrosine aminotransferase